MWGVKELHRGGTPWEFMVHPRAQNQGALCSGHSWGNNWIYVRSLSLAGTCLQIPPAQTYWWQHFPDVARGENSKLQAQATGVAQSIGYEKSAVQG